MSRRRPAGEAPPVPPARRRAGDGSEPFEISLARMNRFQEPEARAAIADLGFGRGSRGLDVGCGIGLCTLWLAEAVGRRGHVIGVEPAEERVAAARALTARRLRPPRLEFRVGDGTALPFSARSFDWLWCGDVLHHIADTQGALREFRRVVRPGGHVVVKESQVPPATFLPGHPALERRLQHAEMQWTLTEGSGRSFQERRQRTLESLRAAGLLRVTVRSYVVVRRAPLDRATRVYIQHTVFDRNWGSRLRDRLDARTWRARTRLCAATSPGNVLARPDYYCLYPITLFRARVPG